MQQYIQKISSQVKSQIEKDINSNTIETVVLDAINFSISNTRAKNFQKYYFTTIGNTQNYLSDTRFFHDFKSKYALQGIDNDYPRSRAIASPPRSRAISSRGFPSFNAVTAFTNTYLHLT